MGSVRWAMLTVWRNGLVPAPGFGVDSLMLKTRPYASRTAAVRATNKFGVRTSLSASDIEELCALLFESRLRACNCAVHCFLLHGRIDLICPPPKKLLSSDRRFSPFSNEHGFHRSIFDNFLFTYKRSPQVIKTAPSLRPPTPMSPGPAPPRCPSLAILRSISLKNNARDRDPHSPI